MLAALVRPDLPMKVNHKSDGNTLKNSTGNSQWSLLKTPTDFDILLVTLFTWSLKVRFSSSVIPSNLTVETFVRIDSLILMCNEVFEVGDHNMKFY